MGGLQAIHQRMLKELNRVSDEVRHEAMIAIHRWVEGKIDDGVNISQIEAELDMLDDVVLKIEGYKHLTSLLGRRVFQYEWQTLLNN